MISEPQPDFQPNLDPQDWAWNFWQLVPIYPYGKRRTLRLEVVKDTIWCFEQVQGIFYVTVPIRMTVVRLETGGLLIYAPVAPTRECLRLVNELVAQHGEVKYIILPTVSGLEHKVFVPAFARSFPTAQVFVAPHQWSFPLNLPLSWLGFPMRRTQVLPADSQTAPFAEEFDYAMLTLNLGLGWFGEVAFYHRRSRTLLVTDSVVSVPEDPPAIVQLDPAPLLFHAKEDNTDCVKDNPATRRKGWQRIALFAFYFRPSALEIAALGRSLQDALKARDRSQKAYFGWYPFNWKPDWQKSFAALHSNGRLFVAPILQQLILNRAPQDTLAWANRITQWDFAQIIPCHLNAPIAASPAQFRQAFAFLEPDAQSDNLHPLPQEDFDLLKQLSATFSRTRILPPLRSPTGLNSNVSDGNGING
jgi:Domain of unknown function (DUF4336)